MEARSLLMVGLLVAMFSLAGCASSSSYDESVVVNFGGSGSGSDDKTIDCGEEGHITVSLGGSGSVTTEIFDGDGERVFQDTGSTNGGYNEVQTLDGAPGEWRLKVQWSNVNGGLNVVLSC